MKLSKSPLSMAAPALYAGVGVQEDSTRFLWMSLSFFSVLSLEFSTSLFMIQGYVHSSFPDVMDRTEDGIS